MTDGRRPVEDPVPTHGVVAVHPWSMAGSPAVRAVVAVLGAP